jgi:hypothetical protein
MNKKVDWKSTSGSAMQNPQANPNCPVCHGGMWVHRRKEDGHVDWSKVYLCKCCKPGPELPREESEL